MVMLPKKLAKRTRRGTEWSVRHLRLHRLKIEFLYHKMILFSPRMRRREKLKYLIFSIIFRRCPGKGLRCVGGWAFLQHSNCAYVKELSNYNFCCRECHDEIDAHYQELWDEYNASRW